MRQSSVFVSCFFVMCTELLLLYIQSNHCYPTINSKQNYVNNFNEENTPHLPELEDTIDEVQQILAKDPTLPRLTRGEIEELYEKVTREEYEKSIEAGDMGRADSMRALMLVLPFNTDNNTEENIQALYTRPPVTRVIDAYAPPNPIKFATPATSAVTINENVPQSNLEPTTYKPSFSFRTSQTAPRPTTYHPSSPPPPVLFRMKPSAVTEQHSSKFRFNNNANLPTPPQSYEYDINFESSDSQLKPVHRFSSHYNARDVDFLNLPTQRRSKPRTSTVRPVADILESLGVVNGGQAFARNHLPIDDDLVSAEESAPQPVIASYVPQTLQSQSLAPKIRPDAYTSFKPLNIGEEIRVQPEVEDYLTRFGIVGGRKKKDLKKNKLQQNDEQYGDESEIATAKVPSSQRQLEKLLENLQELERLNIQNAKTTKRTTTTTPTTTTTTPSPTTTTTTTTTTPPPASISPNLITNGIPLLIEPKKPRRRIDPTLDLHYGSASNQHSEQVNDDQLSKLLENLQELNKLQINPERALKTQVTPAAQLLNSVVNKPPVPALSTTTTAPVVTLGNRFSDFAALQQQLQTQTTQKQQQEPQQNDDEQLRQVLKQLQAFEQTNAKTSITSTRATTTTTTKKPIVRANGIPNDWLQLQKLLTDDTELERLYNQARARVVGSTTSTTTRMPTTTKKPAPTISELEQLQKYLAELERVSVKASTTARSTTLTTTTPIPTTTTTTTTPIPTTTTTTTTTTPAPTTTSTTTTSTTPPPPTETTTTTTTTSTTSFTTTTTARPKLIASDFAQHITDTLSTTKPKAKQSIESEQLQELINRVQHLERLNSQRIESLNNPVTTESPLPFLGFTTHNVNAKPKAPEESYNIRPNDFVNLQDLFNRIQQTNQAPRFGQIEISTAATASEPLQYQQQQRSQNFAQRIIDITNDTGSGSSLREVDPNEFIQLQKLLSKVQELERVKINPQTLAGTAATPRHPNSLPHQEITIAPSLLTMATLHANNGDKLNGPLIIYPEGHQQQYEQFDLPPTYKETSTTTTRTTGQPAATADEYDQHQQLFTHLNDDNERSAYKNLQPPMIYKTVTKEPPRFVVTNKSITGASKAKQQDELEELQKLLNNAQELKKLGVTLPKELSQEIEDKLIKSSHLEEGFRPIQTVNTKQQVSLASAESLEPPEVEEYLTKYGIINSSSESSTDENVRMSTSTVENVSEEVDVGLDDPSEKTVVFSVTTNRPQMPREPKPTTESAVDLPVLSATKIIEDAIKRAASKIGVSTEFPQGFRRRIDTDVGDTDAGDDDMIGEFSEMSYQVAIPEINRALAGDDNHTDEVNENTEAGNDETSVNVSKELFELQRLINNLQELQKLNISTSPELLRKADAKYLESFKNTVNDTNKSRRQSNATTSVSTISDVDVTTKSPTSVGLDLNLDETNPVGDAKAAGSISSAASTSTTTTESPNGSLADLENSFGGPDPEEDKTPEPPKKKNGFYFLADWNSFLEVGDGDDQVVVRLSPKIGDPRLFLPVKTP